MPGRSRPDTYVPNCYFRVCPVWPYITPTLDALWDVWVPVGCRSCVFAWDSHALWDVRVPVGCRSCVFARVSGALWDVWVPVWVPFGCFCLGFGCPLGVPRLEMLKSDGKTLLSGVPRLALYNIYSGIPGRPHPKLSLAHIVQGTRVPKEQENGTQQEHISARFRPGSRPLPKHAFAISILVIFIVLKSIWMTYDTWRRQYSTGLLHANVCRRCSSQ